jgi:hypothetical protein
MKRGIALATVLLTVVLSAGPAAAAKSVSFDSSKKLDPKNVALCKKIMKDENAHWSKLTTDAELRSQVKTLYREAKTTKVDHRLVSALEKVLQQLTQGDPYETALEEPMDSVCSVLAGCTVPIYKPGDDYVNRARWKCTGKPLTHKQLVQGGYVAS